MNHERLLLKAIKSIGLALTLGVSMSACSAMMSWKEEVLLHDGSKIVASRSVSRGGRHEIGQRPSYKEQSLSFIMPSTNQTITWEDRYSEDLASANFLPMLLEIFKGTPYLVAQPMGCLSYNKWGRPNPPYVVFKYQDKEWKRIPLQELPGEITTPNLIFSMPDIEVERIGKRFISAETIKQLVDGYKQPEYKTILREVVKGGLGITSCEVLVQYKCGWGAPGEFNRKYFENTCK